MNGHGPVVPVVIVGATGYVGGELLRLVAGHPDLELHAAVSTSRAGEPVAGLFPGLGACYPDARFVAPGEALDGLHGAASLAIFSAAPHGASAATVAGLLEAAGPLCDDVRVVDVSADFRYSAADDFAAVYGQPHAAPGLLAEFRCALPEHGRGIRSRHIGHPGCFATAMLLAAVPLYATSAVAAPLFITGVTGSTGSGRSPAAGTHHPERHSNLYAYKPLGHRHVPEVENGIRSATGEDAEIRFVPHSGPFARGIYITAQTTLERAIPGDELRAHLRAFYADSPFVRVVDGIPRVKDVVASNYAHLGVATDDRAVAVTCAIDNLVKGAAGGAVQWMNRLLGLPETAGLTAASPAWT